MRNLSQFVIAAPTSGSGKTTICRGLMALLTRKGLRVQPFKCGPDYIDTKFHEQVCGRPSYNLDTFMASESHVRELYVQYSQDADVCIVEGMMGMYDGYDKDKGSCAEIARALDLPVVLVVNSQSAAYSMAPLLSGFMHFHEGVKVVGVVFNMVASVRHFEMLKQVCEDLQLPCFGYLSKQASLEQSSRYLGLDFSEMDAGDSLVDEMERHVDWEALLRATKSDVRCKEEDRYYSTLCFASFLSRFGIAQAKLALSSQLQIVNSQSLSFNILVARNNDSFSFIYAEHLDILNRLGKVTFFNPEENQNIPDDTDLLYLPGGYPEKHAKALMKAKQTLHAVRDYIERGGSALAECGGMIYLSQGIVSEDQVYEMAGVLPFKISMRKEDRKLSLGYRQFIYNGQSFRGHEFHYTQFAPEGDIPASVSQVYDAKGKPVSTPVFRYKNLIASYTHLYWGEVNS